MRAVENGARRGRGLSAAFGAHPQALTRAPATSAAALWTRETVRPSQLPEVFATGRVVGEPRPELLVGAGVVHATDRTQPCWHPTRLTALKQRCRTGVRAVWEVAVSELRSALDALAADDVPGLAPRQQLDRIA